MHYEIQPNHISKIYMTQKEGDLLTEANMHRLIGAAETGQVESPSFIDFMSRVQQDKLYGNCRLLMGPILMAEMIKSLNIYAGECRGKDVAEVNQLRDDLKWVEAVISNPNLCQQIDEEVQDVAIPETISDLFQ